MAEKLGKILQRGEALGTPDPTALERAADVFIRVVTETGEYVVHGGEDKVDAVIAEREKLAKAKQQ